MTHLCMQIDTRARTGNDEDFSPLSEVTDDRLEFVHVRIDHGQPARCKV